MAALRARLILLLLRATRKECANGCTRQRKAQPNSSGERKRTAGKAGGAGNDARFRYDRDIVNVLHIVRYALANGGQRPPVFTHEHQRPDQ